MRIRDMQIDLDELGEVEDGDDRFLIGTGTFLGASFHVHAVRVVNDDGEQLVTHADGEDTEDTEYCEGARALRRLVDGDEPDSPYCTVQLPGREGEWVVWIVPYCD